MREAVEFFVDPDSTDFYALLRSRISQLEARLMATFTEQQIQELWESYDGFETSDEAISGEMIEAEMERRRVR